MKTKTTIAVLLLAAMNTSAQPELTHEWGGDLIEREYNRKRELTRLRVLYAGGAASYMVIDKITSISPWDGVGDPDPEWVVAQGSVWVWWSNQRGGFNWIQKASGVYLKEDIESSELFHDPSPAPSFWGLYRSRDGRYKQAGGFHCGLANTTETLQRVEVAIEWQAKGFSPSHWTTNHFFAPPGKIGWTNPRPGIGRYAWVSDRSAQIRGVR